MIVLDTNVVSELMRPAPDPVVAAWVDRQAASSLYLSAISAGELLVGVALLPDGRRRRALRGEVRALLEVEFAGRVLPYEHAAATHFAEAIATRRRAGRPIAVCDAQIAGVCRSVGAGLATRNTSDFEGLGVELIDPWEAGA